MAQVNIQQLFEDKQERLALIWVAGADGAAKILDSERVNASNQGLIGHLNLIHPNWVQELIDYANRTHTPLFRSPQPSVHLMWLMRHYIVKALADSTTMHGVFLDVQ